MNSFFLFTFYHLLMISTESGYKYEGLRARKKIYKLKCWPEALENLELHFISVVEWEIDFYIILRLPCGPVFNIARNNRNCFSFSITCPRPSYIYTITMALHIAHLISDFSSNIYL